MKPFLYIFDINSGNPDLSVTKQLHWNKPKVLLLQVHARELFMTNILTILLRRVSPISSLLKEKEREPISYFYNLSFV